MVLIKATRAIGWGIGLAMLFVQPIVGVLILTAALAATIYLAREPLESESEGPDSGSTEQGS